MMKETINTKNYLRLIPFINFDLWDTKRYTSKSFTSKFRIVDLGSCIKEENKKYKLFQHKEETFGILGVNNKVGIFDSYELKGKEINQAYKKMEIGWIAYNPYRINVGSIGVRLKSHKNEYISPAYVVFSCNDDILPEFLFLLFKTDTFNKIIKESTTGSVRQNLTIDILNKLKIPLPSIVEQREIIDSYNLEFLKALAFKKQIEALESDIEKYLNEVLGISYYSGVGMKRGLQTVDYLNVEKWSLDDIFKKNTITSSKYKLQTLNELCSLITDGTHQTPTYFDSGVIFLSAKNVTKEVIDWDDIKYVSKEAHDNYCKRVKPEVGDILLAKNGTTGIAALVDVEKEFSIYVSLALLKPRRDLINPYFLVFVINSQIARQQFFSRLIGIGVPNLHLGEIKEVVIPLPSIQEQQIIVNTIRLIKSDIELIESQVITILKNAQVAFENELFI